MTSQPARQPLRLVQERPPGPGLTDYALWMRSRGCGEVTIRDRMEHVGHFARAHPSFPHVRPMHVTTWLGRPGFAPWTRSTYYGHLRSYFDFALENDLISVDPMARMRRPKGPRGVPRPLIPEQVQRLLSTANPDMRTRLLLGLYAGLRAHEIAKIRGEDVNERCIYVLGKGGRSDEIPTHPLIWAEALNRDRVGWWFPSNTKLGRCRHTYATELLRAGVNVRVVQELMRHASLDSTMVYTEVSRAERLDGISRLGAVANNALERAPKATHCDRGHEFTEANTYIKPNGYRQCRACRQARQAAYYARKAARVASA